MLGRISSSLRNINHPPHIHPQVIRCSLQPCEQDPRQASTAVCSGINYFLNVLHTAALPKVPEAGSLSRFLLSQGFHSRQPTLSCNHTSFSRHSLHCITFHSLLSRTLVTFGLLAIALSSHITTIFTPLLSQRSFHFIPFHYFLHLSASLQSTGCHCCARLRCRPGCGLSLFLLLTDGSRISFVLLIFDLKFGCAKNHASPCSFRSCLTALIARSRTPSYLGRAPCSHPTSCSRTLFVEATSFALGGSQIQQSHRATYTQFRP